MLTIFFSGTGNTRYVAEQISAQINASCHSIEDDIDFTAAMRAHDCICCCYPVYGSRVPPIFAQFAKKHQSSFQGKQIVIVATQYLFSGDGARSFTDLFPAHSFDVIYAEHVNMPDNICNLALLPVKNGADNKRKLQKADAKIRRICKDLAQHKTVRRGFNPVSRVLGLSQGVFAEGMADRGRRSVVIDGDCIRCEACVKACPMANLKLKDNKIVPKNNCTMCYRCVNLCPEMAITALLNTKPKIQYHGIRI